jgi:hypothetical protein
MTSAPEIIPLDSTPVEAPLVLRTSSSQEEEKKETSNRIFDTSAGLSLDEPSDPEDDARPVKLRSHHPITRVEGIFVVTRKQAKISQIVKAALEKDSDASEVDVIYRESTVKYIAEFMQHYDGTEPKYPKCAALDDDFEKFIGDKYAAEITARIFASDDLYDVIECANWMGIVSLVHIASAKLAHSIRGKSEEEMRAILMKIAANSIPYHKEKKKTTEEIKEDDKKTQPISSVPQKKEELKDN